MSRSLECVLLYDYTTLLITKFLTQISAEILCSAYRCLWERRKTRTCKERQKLKFKILRVYKEGLFKVLKYVQKEKKILAAFFKLKLVITDFAKNVYLEQFYILHILE